LAYIKDKRIDAAQMRLLASLVKGKEWAMHFKGDKCKLIYPEGWNHTDPDKFGYHPVSVRKVSELSQYGLIGFVRSSTAMKHLRELSDEELAHAFQDYLDNEDDMIACAARYGLSRWTYERFVTSCTSWRRPTGQKLIVLDLTEVRRRRRQGQTFKEIGRHLGCAGPTVSACLARQE